MIVKCLECKKQFDDAVCWTICPHNSLDVSPTAPYCRRHDLYNCPFCTDSEFDALGRTTKVK